MDANRAMMQTKESDLKKTQVRLRLKGKSILRTMAHTLNPALYELEAMEIAQAARDMDDLVMIQAELLSLQSKISELEEALYG